MDRPRAYNATMLELNRSRRRAPLGTILGSNVALRSRGMSKSTAPIFSKHLFGRGSVTVVTRTMTYRITGLITQVIGHLLSQSTFQNPLRQLRQHPIRTQKVHTTRGSVGNHRFHHLIRHHTSSHTSRLRHIMFTESHRL